LRVEWTATDRDKFREYLQGLSTFARFLRFQNDFRRSEGYRLSADMEVIDGATYFRLRLQDACEFASKKDYVDNWQSEMHETFCYWSLSDWRLALEKVGFTLHPASHAYANPWIVDNRLRNTVKLYRKVDGRLELLHYPVTNVMLIAEKL
jgi:hypothetical protein